jgi:hypothetical protein
VHTTRLAATLAATALILTLAGCGDDAKPTSQPTNPPAATTAPATPVDTYGQQACTQVSAALGGHSARDVTSMRKVADLARQSTTPGVSAGGVLLARAADRAAAARGASDEPRMVTMMVTAATELSTDCIRAGLPG